MNLIVVYLHVNEHLLYNECRRIQAVLYCALRHWTFYNCSHLRFPHALGHSRRVSTVRHMKTDDVVCNFASWFVVPCLCAKQRGSLSYEARGI